MALVDEKYMLLTTTRRNGTAVPTPVWLASLGGNEVGFWSSSQSGKVKRLAHTPEVTVQACDARGTVKPGSTAIPATARVVTGPELATVRTRIVQKYGLMARTSKPLVTLGGLLRGRRRPYADVGVIVTLPEA